jgi:3-oxoacyl-[acyl-carrier-protein] synthase III
MKANNLSRARVAAFGFEFPGQPIILKSLVLNDADTDQLRATGQEFTYRSESDSTELSILAAGRALAAAGVPSSEVGLVVSAPSLISAHALEIPAVTLRARLGLGMAECLNVVQGCVGGLLGIRLAAQHVAVNGGAALVATGCRASPLTDNMSHGSFFWGDGAGAVVLVADDRPGLRPIAYAEVSADEAYGAMRIDFGDGYRPMEGRDPHRIRIEFASARERMNYVAGERKRFRETLESLLDRAGIDIAELSGIFLPATGSSRFLSLVDNNPELIARIGTDFRRPHIGGVDVLFFLNEHLRAAAPGQWLAALSPAFTAQWAGLIFRNEQ